MEKTLPQPESGKHDQLDKKAERIKKTIAKMEKSVIDIADEGAMAARAGMTALSFGGMTPVTADDADEE